MKNKVIAMFAVLVMLAGLTGCGRLSALTERVPDPVRIKTVTVTEQTPDWTIDVKYPAVQGMEGQAGQDRLNRMLDASVKKDIQEIKAGALALKKDGQLRYPFELVAVYRVSYNQHGLLSFTTETYQYTNGAHGMTYRVSYNYDTVKGQPLMLKDLFVSDYSGLDKTVAEVIRQIKQKPDIFFPTAAEDVKKAKPSFYLTGKGLVVYYGLYELAPYAAGFSEFSIPYRFYAGNLVYEVLNKAGLDEKESV